MTEVQKTHLPETQQAVQALLAHLHCDHCSGTLHKLYSLGGQCDHVLCESCVDPQMALLDNGCPVCGAACRGARDLRMHGQWHQLVLLSRRLLKLITTAASRGESGEEADDSSPPLISPLHSGLMPPPPVPTRELASFDRNLPTRKRVSKPRGQSERQKLADSHNRDWGIPLLSTTESNSLPQEDPPKITGDGEDVEEEEEEADSSAKKKKPPAPRPPPRKRKLPKEETVGSVVSASKVRRSLPAAAVSMVGIGDEKVVDSSGKESEPLGLPPLPPVRVTRSFRDSSTRSSIIRKSSVKSKTKEQAPLPPSSPPLLHETANKAVGSSSSVVLKVTSKSKKKKAETSFVDVTLSKNPSATADATVDKEDSSTKTLVSMDATAAETSSKLSTSSNNSVTMDTVALKEDSKRSTLSAKAKNIRVTKKKQQKQQQHNHDQSVSSDCSSPRATGRSKRLSSSPVTPKQLTRRNLRGETSLHQAAIRGDYEKMKALIDLGVDVNTRDNAGWTPLHETANRGTPDCMEALLLAGALPDQSGGPELITPLHDAAENGWLECVRLLVHAGARGDVRNLRGLTPRELGARWPAIVEVLAGAVDRQGGGGAGVASKEAEWQEEGAELDALTPPVIACTGLDRKQRATLASVVDMLGGRLEDSPLLPGVTHLVVKTGSGGGGEVVAVGSCPRTLKYLQGVLTGRWIVGYEWVRHCAHLQARVLEEPFEVPGCSSHASSQAPRKGRLLRRRMGPGGGGLFAGCQFLLRGEFRYPSPSREDLTSLLQAGEGKILTRPPSTSSLTTPVHAREGSPLHRPLLLVVVDDLKVATGGSSSLRQQDDLPQVRVTPVWIMDAVGQFELIDPPDREI